MKDVETLLAAVARSPFRRRFRLGAREQAYLRRKGLEEARRHGDEFVRKRLAPALLANDGRQTPMCGHPIFIAQHATATCCRKCLARWHGIPAGRALDEGEIAYILSVLCAWLERQVTADDDCAGDPLLFGPRGVDEKIPDC